MKVTEHPSYGFVEKWLKENQLIFDGTIPHFEVFTKTGFDYWVGVSGHDEGKMLIKKFTDTLVSYLYYSIPVPDTEEKFLELMKILDPTATQ